MRVFPAVLSVLLLTLTSTPVLARDLQGRVGLGYNAQFDNASTAGGVSALSLKWAVTKDIAINPIVGVATSNPGNSVFGVKFYKNVFYETNLNFYFLLGGGLVTGGGASGAQVLGGFGAEFFIPGVESLGFSFEAGGALSTLSGTILKTYGASLLNAGIHFYF